MEKRGQKKGNSVAATFLSLCDPVRHKFFPVYFYLGTRLANKFICTPRTGFWKYLDHLAFKSVKNPVLFSKNISYPNLIRPAKV